MILLGGERFDTIADMLGDTPFTVTPYLFLRRRECDVYTDDPMQPRCVVLVPHLRFADVYVFVTLGLEVEAMEDLGDFVESLELEGELLDEAAFLYQNCYTPEALLARGLASGVFRKGRLASPATLLALTPGYCDVGVYILPRYRHRGYAMDCVEALFAEAFDRGVRPLWRIGIRPKLGMEEIGTTGRKVYLQPVPVR